MLGLLPVLRAKRWNGFYPDAWRRCFCKSYGRINPVKEQCFRYGNSFTALIIFVTVKSLADVKKLLEQIKPELETRFHVREIGLFGSIVRDDFTLSSDIDIIVNFSRPVGIEFVDLADYIESKLQRRVDLVSRTGIKDKYFRAIEPQILYV